MWYGIALVLGWVYSLTSDVHELLTNFATDYEILTTCCQRIPIENKKTSDVGIYTSYMSSWWYSFHPCLETESLFGIDPYSPDTL